MTLVPTVPMRFYDTDPPFLPFWVWSTLLHVGAITLLSFFHFASQTESTRSVVQVTLVDTTATSPQPQQPVPKPQETVDPAPPPLLKTPRRITPVSPPSIARAQPLESPKVRTTLQRVTTPIQSQERVTPIQRQVLRDHRATDHLIMKNYLKVAQRKTLTGPPVSGPTPSTDFSVTAALPPATIPSPGQGSTTSYSPTPTRRPIKPHVLQAKPATIGELSQSKAKVGTAIPLVYPLIAKKNEWEGTVRVRVVVQPSGFPETIRIQKSSGHNVLDNAAVEALRKTRFIPAKDGNIPVRSIVEIPIKFDLKNPT